MKLIFFQRSNTGDSSKYIWKCFFINFFAYFTLYKPLVGSVLYIYIYIYIYSTIDQLIASDSQAWSAFIQNLLLARFSHQFSLLIFHCSLKSSKTRSFTRTLLSIQTDFNSAVVWLVSILPLIYSSSSLFSLFLGKYFKDSNYDGYHCHLLCPTTFFISLARSRYLSTFSLLSIFSLLE